MQAYIAAIEEIHRDKNTQITEVELLLADAHGQGLLLTARGQARRHPDDKYDRETADLLALGRAFQALGSRIVRRANGRVKMLDDLATGKVNSSTNKAEIVHKAVKATKATKKTTKKVAKKAAAKKTK